MAQQFKEGDKVKVISWYYKKIPLPQDAVIIKIDQDDNEDLKYRLKLTEDHYGKSQQWYFKEGEFELINTFEAEIKEATDRERVKAAAHDLLDAAFKTLILLEHHDMFKGAQEDLRLAIEKAKGEVKQQEKPDNFERL